MSRFIRRSIPVIGCFVLNSVHLDRSRCKEAQGSSSKSTPYGECAETVCSSRMDMLHAAMKSHQGGESKQSVTSSGASSSALQTSTRKDCPVDREELGAQTWTLLHTIAAYFPDHPTPSQESYAHAMFSSLSQLYPCHVCAEDFQVYITEFPPNTASRESLMMWVCAFHNSVNVKVGKPSQSCSVDALDERWRVGTDECRGYNISNTEDVDNLN